MTLHNSSYSINWNWTHTHTHTYVHVHVYAHAWPHRIKLTIPTIKKDEVFKGVIDFVIPRWCIFLPSPVYSSIIIERYIGMDGTQNDRFVFKFFHERYDTTKTIYNFLQQQQQQLLTHRPFVLSRSNRISQITIENQKKRNTRSNLSEEYNPIHQHHKKFSIFFSRKNNNNKETEKRTGKKRNERLYSNKLTPRDRYYDY